MFRIPLTGGHYIKIGHVRVPCYSPTEMILFPPPRKPDLPEEHPCHGCVALDQNNETPFCFLPVCTRSTFEKYLGIKERDQQMNEM